MKLIDVLKEIAELGSRTSRDSTRSPGARNVKVWMRDFVKAYKMMVPTAIKGRPVDIIRIAGKDKVLRMYRRGVDPSRAVKISLQLSKKSDRSAPTGMVIGGTI